MNKQKSTILFTGTDPQNYKALDRCIHFPMIEISKAKLTSDEIKTIKSKLQSADLLLFTSRFAVKYFFECLRENGIKLKDIEVAVIGKHTAVALKPYSITPKVIAHDESSEGFLAALQEHYTLNGKTIIFPRSSLPNPFLKRELGRLGSTVYELTVYNNVKPKKRELPRGIHQVFFTSPSTVRNFLRDYRRIPKEWQILSKGPLTSAYLREQGYDDIKECR